MTANHLTVGATRRAKSARFVHGWGWAQLTTYDTGGGNIRKVTLGILGAAAAVASLLLIRQTKQLPPEDTLNLPAGEVIPGNISLERLRELGI